MFWLRKSLPKISFVFLISFTVFVAVKTEEYPRNSRSRTYFQNFEDVGKLTRLFRSPDYEKVISEIDELLSAEPLLGLDKVVKESFAFNKDKRRSSDTEVYTSENIPEVVRSHFIRKRQAENNTGTFAETTPVSSTLKQRDASNGSTTYSFKTTNSISFATTSEQPSLPGIATDPVTSETQSVTATSQPTLTQCEQDVNRIFTGMNNQDKWALELIDSWGKPGSGLLKGQVKFVGDYQECQSSRSPPTNATVSAGFKGKYCAVGLVSGFDMSQNLLSLLMSAGTLEIGACLPDTCSAVDIFSLFTKGLVSANLTSAFTVGSIDCRTDDREYTSATICAIILLSVIGALMVIGTVLDVIFVQWPKWSAKRKLKQADENGYHTISAEESSVAVNILSSSEKTVITNGNGHYSVSDTEKQAISSSLYSENTPLLLKGKSSSHKGSACIGIFCKVFLSFSVYTNGQKLLNTAQPPGSLSAIHGIRFFSMSWVILGHLFIFSPGSFKNTATAMPVFLQRWTFDGVSNALVSVDTFFTLSGLLTAYVATKEIQKKGWKLNWPMYYFHRFWRLTPPYMLVLVTVLGLQRFMGSGALWPSSQPMDKTYCEERWWTNLLYINNLVKSEEMCMGQTWYLANDMQFYILSPLMIVPFYFNKYAGVGSCLLFLLVSWITTGVLSTINKWPSTLLKGTVAVEGVLDYQNYYYYAPYSRIGPYVVGILTGYLLAVTKGKIHMRWYFVVLGWAIAIAVALACLYGIHGDITDENVSSVGVSAFYNVVARSAWGACISWVIVTCVAGYGGPVNAILSWSPFVFLGRLTYMSYLIHPTVIYVYFQNMDQLYHLNDTNLVISYLGLIFFISLASFVLVLGFESPMIGLEKVFLRHQ